MIINLFGSAFQAHFNFAMILFSIQQQVHSVVGSFHLLRYYMVTIHSDTF